MKVTALLSCILLSILVLLLYSMAAQATEYREVNATVKADDILKHIENSEDINLTNCRIVGDLNVSNIKLETITSPAFNKILKSNISSKESLIYWGLKENSSIIKSNITVKNSTFESSLDFSNVYFKDFIYFDGTTFKDVDFKGASFSNPTYFYKSNFGNSADFSHVYFINSVTFNGANFGRSANFFETNFGNHINLTVSPNDILSNWPYLTSASFSKAHFGDNATFTLANFGDKAIFFNTSFGDNAAFVGANFGDSALFVNTSFGDFAYFLFTKFGNYVNFEGAHFGNSANFQSTNFTDTVEFIGPDTSEDIITDAKTCEFFRKYYKNEARYEDADNIYYNYRRFSQGEKSLISLSKWMDILSWITCGYGLRLTNTLWCGAAIIMFFTYCYRPHTTVSVIESKNNKASVEVYWEESGIYRLSNTGEKISILSFWDSLYFSISTFTRLGSTDLYPRENFRKWVTFEGLLGWVMLGIFMATLTNLMIRS